MAFSTAAEIAESLINLSHEKHDPISNLKLQKLLYYAQAWSLVLFDQAIFAEDVEAWVHGPVVPAIFKQYRDYRWNPLPRSAVGPSSCNMSRHLEEVWKVYGKFQASELERITHSESPWKDARAGLPSDMPSHNVISHDAMKAYYSTLVNA